MIYSGPAIEDVEAIMLDGPCMAALGDTIQYAADGINFVTMKGYVDYSDTLRSVETGVVVEQNITVQALKSDIPVKPGSSARVRLGKLPGMTFRPIPAENDISGNYWYFEVQSVA